MAYLNPKIHGYTCVCVEAAPPPVRAEQPPTPGNRKNRAGKENARVAGGGKGGGQPPNKPLQPPEAYEAFARTDRTKENRRPEWNTHRPSRRFVPASERYPASLQKSRRESRLKRQEEVLALQHRNFPPANTHAESNRAGGSAKRGRSPPITQRSLEFIPYVRTDDVVHLEPGETAHALTALSLAPPPPDDSSSSSSPGDLLAARGAQRQREILRGLARLRQGLLDKQRELEGHLRRGHSPPEC